MKDNIKFYAVVFAALLVVVCLSAFLLGGYGLLLDCVIFGGLAAWAD